MTSVLIDRLPYPFMPENKGLSVPFTPVQKTSSSLTNQDVIKSIITTIALNSLKELAISLAITGVTCLFVATPAIPTLIIVAVSIVALNTIFRTFSGLLTYQLHQLNQSPSAQEEERESVKMGIKFCQFMCPITFSILDSTNRDVLIHEAGHALAAAAVYQKARPTIEIFPLEGGVTRFFITPLTKLGNFLGEKNARLFVTAAGPGAAILAAATHIGLAHYLKDSHPELSHYFLCTAITSVFQHVTYALSALWMAKPSIGHDFVHLWQVGNIHPIVAAITMVAIPLVVKGALFAIEHYRSKKEVSL
ncbi:hypothetical protein [Candidatus Protochlamydia phocaeensis]|uniref:hypothetical protein n=1 Tax=Candidatus Protochlamydia phocaeensis TaxID=1414722 RepID=UPI0008387B6B|nr:hypothetical protein [Candidatus Protochlamydia phocaeensis]